MYKKWKKGSFTIEASILIPFILFLMMTVLRIGIEFYWESAAKNQIQEEVSFDAVSMFYRLQTLEELEEEVIDESP